MKVIDLIWLLEGLDPNMDVWIDVSRPEASMFHFREAYSAEVSGIPDPLTDIETEVLLIN